MDDYQSLNHTKWECKYPVMFIPKCRRKAVYAELRRHLDEVFRRLAEQKESRIEEGHLTYLLPGIPSHTREPVQPLELRSNRHSRCRWYRQQYTHSNSSGRPERWRPCNWLRVEAAN